MATDISTERPLFSAVPSSTRQLFLLLRCISFAPKAQVQITHKGLRFMAEESQVMQGEFKLISPCSNVQDLQMKGMVFLERSLFTSYNHSLPTEDYNDDDNEPAFPVFQISLSSLLETLQIFGINDIKDRWASRETQYGANGAFSRNGAFENRVLGMTGMCRLSYEAEGDPLCIVLEETGVSTTCELTTFDAEFREDIPLDREHLAHKIIMRANWLHDAINELSSTSPSRLTIAASPSAPYFTLSSNGPLGSATVEFSKDAQLLETFQVPSRTVNTYKYSMIKNASKAMGIASKVSIRCDEQGVLSLQFMVEVEGGGVSFVDFRYVPYLPEDGEGDEEGDATENGGLE